MGNIYMEDLSEVPEDIKAYFQEKKESTVKKE